MLSVNRRANDVRTLVADWRSSGHTVGFIPTMGALHEGHGSLIRASLDQCDRTLVSIFVNPLQFDRDEDLATYPVDSRADQNFVADLGAHALFLPSVEEMYPSKQLTLVTQSELTDHLDGAARPGFFDGILTVVLKLFHMVNPDIAFFGQKDYQQVAVVRRMVEDLNMTIKIHAMPTERESNGLALSSRNRLLAKTSRSDAPKLFKCLNELRSRFRDGETEVRALVAPIRKTLAAIPDARIDYISVVDGQSLQLRTDRVQVGDVVAIAVFLGEIRLIDNIILSDHPWKS